jgi:vacuolar protein sorting-associated protein 35
VQHAGNILPRLYLLVTVGSVYIRSRAAPARDVLRDMAEMARGVQHATRGLFLRHHLSQLTKDTLPDTGNAFSGAGGDVRDSVDFTVGNFTEMNKLWVRMQHQGPGRDRERRERERRELRLLVGTNLVRLSQLEGVDAALYAEVVLPRVLEQVVNCRDEIAQQYLMDCVIQVFPDDFHLRTLEAVLAACAQLHEGVNVTAIVMALLDRLRVYASENHDLVPEDIRVFDIFTTHIARIIQQRPSMQLVDILGIQLGLLQFALRCYPGNLAYIDQVLEFCAHVLHRMSREGKQKLENPACVRLVVQLLTALLDLDAARNQVLVILEFDNYPELMQYLHVSTRKTVAMAIVQSVLKHRVPLDDHDKVAKLLAFLRPLLRDDPAALADDADREDFDEEQHLVARLVHLLGHSDTDEAFRVMGLVRKHFGQGGTQRIAHTLPPLVFRTLQLAHAVRAREIGSTGGGGSGSGGGSDDAAPKVSCRKVFQFAHEAISALAAEYPELALRLFLQAALSADACGLETICYEFVTQGFVIFEDELAASKAQYAAILLIIGTLERLRCFTDDNRDVLAAKASLYAAKLLKKPDQCRAISAASHLFWSPAAADDDDGAGDATTAAGRRNGKRVLECLQKALKIADTCMAASLNVLLFIEILNRYVLVEKDPRTVDLFGFNTRCTCISIAFRAVFFFFFFCHN